MDYWKIFTGSCVPGSRPTCNGVKEMSGKGRRSCTEHSEVEELSGEGKLEQPNTVGWEEEAVGGKDHAMTSL